MDRQVIALCKGQALVHLYWKEEVSIYLPDQGREQELRVEPGQGEREESLYLINAGRFPGSRNLQRLSA